MRYAILVAAGMVVACGGAGGQEKNDSPKYDSVKELDKRAKAALDAVKKRGDGFVDKGIVAFGEVITRADPASAAAQRVAGQASFFQTRLFSIKENEAFHDYQLNGGDDRQKTLAKVRADRALWEKVVRPASQDLPALDQVWAAVQREWSLQDLKK